MVKKLLVFLIFFGSTTLLCQYDLTDKLKALGKGTVKGAVAMTGLVAWLNSPRALFFQNSQNSAQKIIATMIFAGIPISLLLLGRKARYLLPPIDLFRNYEIKIN